MLLQVTPNVLEVIRKDILQKTIDGMRQDGNIYKGI